MSSSISNKRYSREYIINTMYDDFMQLIDEGAIEKSLIKLGIITSLSVRDLKDMYINRELSVFEISELTGFSLGHIQKMIAKYKLQKINFGITSGNNQAVRRGRWRHNIRVSQPHRKSVVAYKIGKKKPFLEADSISEMAQKLDIKREYVRDCLLPHKQRNTSMGYRFEYSDII